MGTVRWYVIIGTHVSRCGTKRAAVSRANAAVRLQFAPVAHVVRFQMGEYRDIYTARSTN